MVADERTPPDTIDRRIAGLLADDGRMSVADVAQAVRLSRSATSERIRRLERDGWIKRYRAEIDPEMVGRRLEVLIDAKADPDADRDRLEAWLCEHPAIVEAQHLTGAYDYVIRAWCRDPEELDGLVAAMKQEQCVAQTETRLILRRLPVAGGLVSVSHSDD